MKKVLTVLAILAIAMGMTFAADVINVSGDVPTGSESAQIKVVLDLSKETDLTKYFEIGFSSSPVTYTASEDPNLPTVAPLEEINLSENNNGEAVSAANSAYIYWIVKNQKISISMKAGENLKSTSDTTGIVWTASANSVSSKAGDADATEVITVDATQEGSKIIGSSTPLTVSTQNLLTNENLKAEEYSSTLTLTISTAV